VTRDRVAAASSIASRCVATSGYVGQHQDGPTRNVTVSVATIMYNRPVLHAIALRLTGSDATARRLVQRVTRRALRSPGGDRPSDNLKGWLVRLLYETYIDDLRAWSRLLGIPPSRILRGRRAWRRLLARHLPPAS